MSTRKKFYIHIIGTGINQTFTVVSHEVKGYPAGTYHVFEMENGAVVFMNDFGIRTVTVADAPEKLN